MMIIRIENAPKISGLKFRHFKGEGDYASIAAVLSASEAADQLERKVDATDIARAYQHLSNCDPYRDVIIAVVAGKMVGYTRGWWEEGVTNQRWYCHNGFLMPEWRRKGIGRALLFGVEQRLRELALSHPPQLEKLYQVNITQFQQGTAIMLERSGYRPVRYYYLMVRPSLDDISEFPLPEGVEIRSVIPDHYPAIWKAIVETNQDEWGHKKLTEEDYQEWLTSPHFQPELWQVAWDIASGQVAGTVLTFINHEENQQLNHRRGYTEGIGVVRTWRRRGLARALIGRSLVAQKAAGMTESALVVDSKNPNDATSLYESCGFKISKRDTLYRKPLL